MEFLLGLIGFILTLAGAITLFPALMENKGMQRSALVIACIAAIVVGINFAANSIQAGDDTENAAKNTPALTVIENPPKGTQTIELSNGYEPAFYDAAGEYIDVGETTGQEDYLFGAFELTHNKPKYSDTSGSELLALKGGNGTSCELNGVNKDDYRECMWVGQTLVVKVS